MAQWDSIGIQERWGEYYAGLRAYPPKERMLASGDETEAREWAVVLASIESVKAKRFTPSATEVLLQIEAPGQ